MAGFCKKSFLSLIIAFCFCLVSSPAAMAGYSVGFATNEIQIASPPSNGTEVHGILPISGTAIVDEVWFCVRGPKNEVEAQFAPVSDGEFSIELALRFGPGKYTIWADDNKTSFDGEIRFIAYNVVEDNRYTSASTYVDSNNAEIIKLSRSLVNENMTDIEKAEAIHDWVAGNIEYDYEAYLAGDLGLKTASVTLKNKSGLCGGYSFLFAALCRAADLPARVIYGKASGTDEWETQSHAWNEVMADGKWIPVDTTWDSGYIQNDQFILSLSHEYFDPTQQGFAKTHSGSKEMLY